MIQDIAPHRMDNQFMAAIEDPETARLPGNLVPVDSRRLRPDFYFGDENRHIIFEAYTAGQLARWYHDNRYCGTCAHKTVPSKTERALCCPQCGRTIYPRILPAVIIGVTDGDRILMTKYAGREYKRYALIAGFTEIGETVEETVQREVMEEVGLKVKKIRYYKSQPWGFDSNLLLGFFCELADEHEICLDREELSLAEWVDYHDILDDPEKLSLTHNMMEYFRDQKKAGVWNIDAVS